ncbi:MAG: chromosomal replication initiator protein DnaA [Acidimicrobiales bacterium]
MADAQLLWKSCAEVVRDHVSEAVWLSSFAEIAARTDDKGRLVLAVPSPWVRERIESRYRNLIEAALADVGARSTDVVVEVAPSTARELRVTDPLEADGNGVEANGAAVGNGNGSAVNAGARTRAEMTTATDGWSSSSFNPRYRFEGFVIGASNRFAHAAALTVAERPGQSYNPLFIYGDAGLGKTHLLQAVASYVRENYPTFRVRYVSSETFLNEFVDSIRTNSGMAFRRRYRDIDVLLVDDIQFVEGKKETQEEFFHTFNALYEGSRQIVLSSDRPPDAIPTLEDRLRSRFKMGLITDIQPPDLETRLAILRKRAEREDTYLPNEVLEYIATNITDNIRELEGALTRVAAFTSLTNEPASTDLAERVLGDLLKERQPRPITPKVILEATSNMFGFTIDELLSRNRSRPLVTARQIAMYVCRVSTDLSFPQIAKAFNKGDHTTVMHAVQKIENQMRERRQIYDQVQELSQKVINGW